MLIHLKILFFGLLFAAMGGCATNEYRPLPTLSSKMVSFPKKEGIYHKVLRGQTLWSIAQMYGVGLQDIIESNNIPKEGAIEVDQLIFIPGGGPAKNMARPSADYNKNEFIWPIKGRILVYFNDPLGGHALSRGIDIQASSGDSVFATREGHVVLAGYISGYGETLMIDHQDGFISVYAHNAKLLVKLNDHVFKGEPIAQVGVVGAGTFEHFEIRRGKTATNPLYYLP